MSELPDLARGGMFPNGGNSYFEIVGRNNQRHRYAHRNIFMRNGISLKVTDKVWRNKENESVKANEIAAKYRRLVLR